MAVAPDLFTEEMTIVEGGFSVDIADDDKECLVKAELSEIKTKGVKLMVHDAVLTMMKEEKDEGRNDRQVSSHRVVPSVSLDLHISVPSFVAAKTMQERIGSFMSGRVINFGGKSMKSQRFLVYGLLLMMACLGGCATDASKLGHGKRVGGQDGVKEHLEKGRVVPTSPAERIGGQSGLEKPLEKGTAIPSGAGERVGGQSGQELPLEK